MRILIADDHPFIRKGIRETLLAEFGVRDVVEAVDGTAAYDRLTAERFDLAIIDISMPGKDGLDLIRDTLALRPNVRFLVMSVYSEREFAERAYQSGAKGYLDKMSPPDAFVEAVRRISAGKTYVSQEYAEALVDRLAGQREARGTDSLTEREFAVLRLFASGASLTDIGKQLHISIKTVSTHKSRLMEKLGLNSNAELVAFAIRSGLLNRPST